MTWSWVQPRRSRNTLPDTSLLQSQSRNESLTSNTLDLDGSESAWPKPLVSSSMVRFFTKMHLLISSNSYPSIPWYRSYRFHFPQSGPSHTGQWCSHCTKPSLWIHLPNWLGLCPRYRHGHHNLRINIGRVGRHTIKMSGAIMLIRSTVTSTQL